MQPFLEGWTFKDLGLDGGPYDETGHPKVVLHTTEGSSLSGAEAAFAAYPPHLGYDPIIRTKHQYVRLDRHSYALRGDESDDEFAVQVEIVGFASQTHQWSDQIYRNIANDIIKPLTVAIGVPQQHLRFYRQDEGIVLASATSPIRLSNTAFRSFSGWLGHQHIPAPDVHWDPGGFLIDKALEYAKETTLTCAFSGGDRALLQASNARTTAYVNMLSTSDGQGDPSPQTLEVVGILNDIHSAVANLGTAIGQAITDYLNTHPLTVSVDNEAIATAVWAKARDNDPTTGPTS